MSPTRTRRRLPVVLTVVGALVLGLGAVATLGWCSVMGCTVLSERFRPDGEEAVRARAAASSDIARVAGELASGHPVIAATTLDDCLSGQNNWKVKDTYSHECFVRDSRVLDLATSDEEVGPALDAFDGALRARGCEPSLSGGLARVRAEYWSADNPNVVREGAAGLPETAYDCPDGVRIEARPSSAASRQDDPRLALGPTSAGSDLLGGEPYDAADVAALRGSGSALALVVTVSRGYYRTEF
jgi:hypothetical protein